MSIKVLIVDDSFVMRKLLKDILSSDDIEVIGTAKSGKEALKKIPQLKPDVITLDLVMPGWDGLTTLKHIIDENPVPVIILSAHSKAGADITMECLELGAVGFILKPSGELSLDVDMVAPKLLEAVRLAAKVDIRKINALFKAKAVPIKHKVAETGKVIVIGASTGGPQTLVPILASLPKDFLVPVIIVQHMPSIEFTQSLVERFSRISRSVIKVVENNEIINSKTIYLVPGGYSMMVETTDKGDGADVVMRLVKDKPDALTPSINMTMESIAKIYKDKAIGVVLTGMGSDGADGMEAIKRFGGKTLVEDKSALIFGMPKEVIERGCADSVLPANQITKKIVELAEAKA